MESQVIVVVALAFIAGVFGHGRLMDPPSRSSLWRLGYNAPINYDDNQLFCGGFQVQWQVNGGKCGICGDSWSQSPPRNNELGGKYGLGIISRKYKSGSTITASIQITANHKGYFEFRVCPINDSGSDATQECLNKFQLPLADSNQYRYYLEAGKVGYIYIPLQLPPELICSHCVFQWHWNVGNSWGSCGNGTSAVGCGPQETFRGCADISIY